MTKAEFASEMTRRRDAGLFIHASDVPFAANATIKGQYGALWDNRQKGWLLPDAKSYQDACAFLDIEADEDVIASGQNTACADAGEQDADTGDASDAPLFSGTDIAHLRGQVQALLGKVKALEHENLALRSDRDDVRARFTQAIEERDRARADVEKGAKLVVMLQEKVEALQKATPAKGHNLDDATCKKVAEASAKATIDAVLATLAALRAKPSAEQEAARIALASRQVPDAPRPLDLDEAPKAAPETKATPAPAPVIPARKDTISSIWIERAEGPSDLCVEKTFTGPNAINEARAFMIENAETAPSGGGYDKHDFKVTWADGETYSGRFDLTSKGEDDTGNFCVVEHVKREAEYLAGFRTPGHLTIAKHAEMLKTRASWTKETPASLRATYAAFLAERFGVTQPWPHSLEAHDRDTKARGVTVKDEPKSPEAPKAAPKATPASAIMARLKKGSK